MAKQKNVFWQERSAVVSLVVLLILVVISVLAPYLTKFSPDQTDLDNVLQRPSLTHLFGTDQLGRDLMSRTLHGGQVSLAVGFIAVALAILVGTLFGALAGYFGGWLDIVIMRFVDILLALPLIFLLLTIQVLLKPSIYNVMIVIGLTSWMGVARLVRGEILSLREREFVLAARAIGANSSRIIFRHIIPNALGPIVVAATLGMGGAILTESVLSYFGLGVQPPQASWGSLLMDAQAYMIQAWWLAAIPGLFILITVLCLNFVGDGLQKAYRPRERS